MRLFSLMGAYRLLVNNEAVHFTLFFLLHYMDLTPESEQTDESLECTDKIILKKNKVAYVHLVCTILLLLPTIYDKTFNWVSSTKGRVARILLQFKGLANILPIASLVIYTCILFDALDTVNQCNNTEVDSLFFKWVAFEFIIYFSNLVGVAFWLFCKIFISRFNHRIKF